MDRRHVPRITRTRATTNRGGMPGEEEILASTAPAGYRLVHPPPGFKSLGIRYILSESSAYSIYPPQTKLVVKINKDGVPTLTRMAINQQSSQNPSSQMQGTTTSNQKADNNIMNQQQVVAPQQEAAIHSKAESESSDDEENVQRPPTPEHVRRYRHEFELARSFDIEDDLKYCPRHLLEPHELKILEEREKKAAEADQRKSRFGDVLTVINAPPGYPNSNHTRHRSKNSNSPNSYGSHGFPSNVSVSSTTSSHRQPKQTPRSQAWKHRVRGDALPAAGQYYENMGPSPGVGLGGGTGGQMHGYGQGGQYGGGGYGQSGGANYQGSYMGNMQGPAQAGNEAKGNKKGPRQFAIQIIAPMYRAPQDGNNQDGTGTPQGNQGGGASTLQGQQAGGADASQGHQTGDTSAPQGQVDVAGASQEHQAGGSSALHGQAGVSGTLQASASAFQVPQSAQSHENYYYGSIQPGYHGGNQGDFGLGQQRGMTFGPASSFNPAHTNGGIQGGFHASGQGSRDFGAPQYSGTGSSVHYRQGGQGGSIIGGNIGGNMGNMGNTGIWGNAGNTGRRGINPRSKGRGNAYGNNNTTVVPNDSPYTYHGATGPSEGGHARRPSTVPSGVPPTPLYGAAPVFRPQPASINPFFYDPAANKAAARAEAEGKVRCLSTQCLQSEPTYVVPGYFCTMCGTRAPSAEGGNEQS